MLLILYQTVDTTDSCNNVRKSQSIYSLSANFTQGPRLSGATEVSCRVRDQLVEQELIYEKLPKDIAERHVLLMDPILATGNSAARAIQARRAPLKDTGCCQAYNAAYHSM